MTYWSQSNQSSRQVNWGMNRPSAVSRDNDVWGIRRSFIQTCLGSKNVGCLPMLTSPKQSQQRQERIVCEEDSLEYLPRRLKPLGGIWRFSTAWYGTVHFWGVFHWVLYLVPGIFLVPPQPRFQAIRTVTKTWRVNSADHWLAGENRHYCVTELATWDP